MLRPDSRNRLAKLPTLSRSARSSSSTSTAVEAGFVENRARLLRPSCGTTTSRRHRTARAPFQARDPEYPPVTIASLPVRSMPSMTSLAVLRAPKSRTDRLLRSRHVSSLGRAGSFRRPRVLPRANRPARACGRACHSRRSRRRPASSRSSSDACARSLPSASSRSSRAASTMRSIRVSMSASHDNDEVELHGPILRGLRQQRHVVDHDHVGVRASAWAKSSSPRFQIAGCVMAFNCSRLSASAKMMAPSAGRFSVRRVTITDARRRARSRPVPEFPARRPRARARRHRPGPHRARRAVRYGRLSGRDPAGEPNQLHALKA